MKARTLYLILGTVLLSACSHLPETKAELIDYINNKNHGLKKVRQSDEGQFTLSYRPSVWFPNLPESARDYWYFILSLSNQGREYSQNFLATESGYTKAIEQLAFGMEQNSYLITNTADTVYCSASVFPRTYGSLDADKILLAFEKKNIENSKAFRMRIEAIQQEFIYQTKDINTINEIKLSQNEK